MFLISFTQYEIPRHFYGMKENKKIRGVTSDFFLSGFLVIARNPPERFGRKLVEIFPTGLPELLQPSGTKKSNEKL